MRAMSWLSMIALALASIFSASRAGAEESVTITVNTTVLPVCSFSGSVGASRIGGALSPPGALTGAITYRCSNGVAPGFAITASCDGCDDAQNSGPVIVSDGGIGRGMGAGRDLMLVVTGPSAPLALQTAPTRLASSAISVTVSP